MNHHELNIDYLMKENRKLRMELKETKQLKQLHQKVLTQINHQLPHSQIIKTLISIINQTSNKNHTNQLNDYIMELQARLMVLQKISQQTEENEKQTYNLLAQEFQKLKEENSKISDQLHKFYQKIGQVDYISGLVTKYKEIINPTQQAMAFKKQQQQLLDALNLQQETIKKINEEKDKLIKINVFMKDQVEKKKDQIRNMTFMFSGLNDDLDLQNTNNVLDDLDQTEIGQNNQQLYASQTQRSTLSINKISKLNSSRLNSSHVNSNTTLNFIKMQRQLLKDVQQQSDSSFTNDSQLDCPQLSILFPDKVQRIIKNKQQAKIPYLNMKKVRQMMAKREEKMRKQWQQQKHHINPTTKIIQLETELDITRKQLSNQSLKFRLMEEQIKNIRLKIEELQIRNQLLTQSNSKLKINYQIIYKDYQICKSIAMQVERALGMTLGKESELKVKQRLGVILADKKSNHKIENTAQNTNYQLQSTRKNQIYARRLYDVFQQKGLRMKQHRKCYSA